jgi:hypothetical protein
MIGSVLSLILRYTGQYVSAVHSLFPEANIKDFTKEDGCMANISLLGKALACMKTDSGSVMTVVDIAKVFDTIPHAVLRQCLR